MLGTIKFREYNFDEAHCKVKLRSADIVARVSRLDNHGLALDGPVAGEGEFVALAACRVGCGHGGETIGEVVVDGPWGLVGAHEGCASILAAGLSGHTVGQGLVVDVTSLDGTGEAGLAPCAGGFAAVPAYMLKVDRAVEAQEILPVASGGT